MMINQREGLGEFAFQVVACIFVLVLDWSGWRGRGDHGQGTGQAPKLRPGEPGPELVDLSLRDFR